MCLSRYVWKHRCPWRWLLYLLNDFDLWWRLERNLINNLLYINFSLLFIGRVALLWWMLRWYYFQIRVKVSIHLCTLFVRFSIKVDLILRFIDLPIYWDCFDLGYFRLKYSWMMIFTNLRNFFWISHISINWMANLSIWKRGFLLVFCSVSVYIRISFAFSSLLRRWFLNWS